MTDWVVVVDKRSDFTGIEDDRSILRTREYIAKPGMLKPQAPKIINLSRSYAYLSEGYYTSLLAEARNHRVMPTVDTILQLRQRSLYSGEIADLEDELNRRVKRLVNPPTDSFRLLIAFGYPYDGRFQAFARHVFDTFRAPLLELRVRHGEWLKITSIRVVAIDELDEDQHVLFNWALDQYTRAGWRKQKPRIPAKYTMAVLYNPKEEMPPSDPASLKKLIRVAEGMGVDVELIEKKDYLRLAEYDALFIRETTTIENHTYRFAKRAEVEGMPVIDDPTSILRCTNKVYLAELLKANKVPTPKTIVVNALKSLEELEGELTYPMVLKIPDGSFSRGVHKAGDRTELKKISRELLEESDLILAQEFMPTDYDWRVGVLDGEPLFVCQYLMAKKHWQIVKHNADGPATHGGFKSFTIEQAPKEVIDTAVRAARLIGNGLYGVDLKQNERGVFVIEINDNPNLDTGVEDSALKDELWKRLVGWFLKRLEA
ncbi:MAG: RimK family protein [Alphaproteobacteria bacterium]|nr:RimK family protein [Alphaproteobacteria bacterium]MBU0798770.1 RimK family protein [Alphaproteobacteria bacterium]MBU1812022.1 RimK family protein [Alphaproteobacteria bacterium]MBU2089012.1 RimK family protein [Alphaproteobacteria bacterium]